MISKHPLACWYFCIILFGVCDQIWKEGTTHLSAIHHWCLWWSSVLHSRWLWTHLLYKIGRVTNVCVYIFLIYTVHTHSTFMYSQEKKVCYLPYINFNIGKWGYVGTLPTGQLRLIIQDVYLLCPSRTIQVDDLASEFQIPSVASWLSKWGVVMKNFLPTVYTYLSEQNIFIQNSREYYTVQVLLLWKLMPEKKGKF